MTRVPADPQAHHALVLRLARAAGEREGAELRAFLSFVCGAYSTDVALDVAAAVTAAARACAAEAIGAVIAR